MDYESELSLKYDPRWAYGYVLSVSGVLERDIARVAELCPNVSIICVEELDVFLLGLSATGSDYSDELELALLIIDCVSYIDAKEILNLDKKGEALLRYLRDLSPMQRRGLSDEDMVSNSSR